MSSEINEWSISNTGRDEHFKRSPDCAFFTLVNNGKNSAAKRTKAKKDRTSKASRLSTQSTFTINSDAVSVADLPAEEGDSILTTATNATASQGGKRTAKGKKGTTAKGRKTKTKKSEAVEVAPAPEPEDDDFEVKVDLPQKLTRGRKRKTEDSVEAREAPVEDSISPPAKRRATRTRASVASTSTVLGPDDSTLSEVRAKPSKPAAAGRKKGRQSTRKVSTASIASLRAPIPDDDEIYAALEADLNRHMTDEEDEPIVEQKSTNASGSNMDYDMFATEPVKIDEAAIDRELAAMEVESKPLPKAKVAKGKQPRKVSAKQQGAAKKAAKVEAAAVKAAALEEEDISQQISAELEHSISTHHSSPPVLRAKKQRASRQPSKQLPARSTRGSVLTVDQSNLSNDDRDVVMDDQNEESGNDTDASMASQSTVIRASKTRRGSTMKNGKGVKKLASKNIEEIVHKARGGSLVEVDHSSVQNEGGNAAEDISMTDERFYTPAPEAHEPIIKESYTPDSEAQEPFIEESVPEAPKPVANKPRGRPPKVTPLLTTTQAEFYEKEQIVEDLPAILPKGKAPKVQIASPARSPTPPPREITPSQSPQSSDAENRPPSSKPAASARKVGTPHSTTSRVPLAVSTPGMSPSKRNIIAGLQTSEPWTAVDLDAIFLRTPGSEHAPGNILFGDALDQVKKGTLISPEKNMTVEEWIHYNAEMAEEKLRGECERMVGAFEREGTRAMRALEGIECTV